MDATTDGTTGDGGDGGTVDCSSATDGTACEGGFICLSGVCRPSECGDGFVDMAAGEVCDDGNEVPSDGCEPSCELTCAGDEDCDDGDPCNGAETCNMALNRCQAGTPMNGVACTLEAGGDGVCSSGLCAPPGCGNDVVDAGEDCDDGMNGDNDDGCKDDCTFSCEEDADCSDGDMCSGEETCDTDMHVCVAGTDLDCDDGDPCSADSCDASTGCVNELIDGDGDTYATATCTTSGFMGGDCDDTRSDVYPGAAELCDMVDNDCDGTVDDGTTSVTCRADADGDGYGSDTDSVEDCSCPSGYIPPRGDGRTDCRDDLVDVHEGQTSWFSSYFCLPRALCSLRSGQSYDYNCDGTETRRWTRTNRTSCSSLDCNSGWTGGTVPDCGETAQLRSCSLVIDLSGVWSCNVTVSNRRQECR
jgi:cysteine-rich repeat protein